MGYDCLKVGDKVWVIEEHPTTSTKISSKYKGTVVESYLVLLRVCWTDASGNSKASSFTVPDGKCVAANTNIHLGNLILPESSYKTKLCGWKTYFVHFL